MGDGQRRRGGEKENMRRWGKKEENSESERTDKHRKQGKTCD